MGTFLIGCMALVIGAVIGFIFATDRPPSSNACQCYYDGEGKRAWPGYNCPVHKRKEK